MRYLLPFLILYTLPLFATDYHVGPTQALTAIADVPWATLQAGDRVFIHWRSTPYKEKWVINRQGTAANRIEVIGVSGTNGEKPIIDGNGATTPTALSYWNEVRGVLKIGGSSIPADGIPSYITIENLEIRSGRPPYSFTDDSGNSGSYSDNAAAIYIEKGQHIIIRNCILHDSGNGIFMGSHNGDTQEILFEKNYIFDNGIVGQYLEHNTYTEGINVTYQFNRFGPLRSGATGNNLKDRSAGLVVRYNWIESGNRQLDLVESGSAALVNHANYNKTHVYGNVLIEPEDAGNSQIVHYGGDNGNQNNYRKGDLYFFNNTVISTRSGNTTLVRLSSSDETAQAFNNIIYPTAAGNKMAMINGDGTFNMHHNWLKTGWQSCHCSPSGAVNDLGDNLTGTDPSFVNFSTQDFMLSMNSAVINQGTGIPTNLLPDHSPSQMYAKHTDSTPRTIWNTLDMGAFEFSESLCTDVTEFENGSWSNGVPDATKMAVIKSNYSTSIYGSIEACACTVEAMCLLTITSGMMLQVDEDLIIEGFLDAQQGSNIQVQSEY